MSLSLMHLQIVTVARTNGQSCASDGKDKGSWMAFKWATKQDATKYTQSLLDCMLLCNVHQMGGRSLCTPRRERHSVDIKQKRTRHAVIKPVLGLCLGSALSAAEP